MARLVVLDPDYDFGDLGLEGGAIRLDGQSSIGFTAQIGNDLFVFEGSRFTYASSSIRAFRKTFDANLDLVTGGTVTSYEFREDGVPSFRLDRFSDSARSLTDLSTLIGENGPLLFHDVLRGNDEIILAGGDDTIDAGRGNDLVTGGGGSDRLNGGPGVDTAVFPGGRGSYSVAALEDRILVRDLTTGEVDVLRGFERLSFSGVVEAAPRPGRDTALEYIASYPDLIATYGPDAAAGRRHLETVGLREGRVVTFDGYEYIASHPDLIAAYGANQDQGARHYIVQGFSEGRSPDLFDARQYLANYADLRAAFGTDEQAAAIHFIRHGFREGRTDDPFFT